MAFNLTYTVTAGVIPVTVELIGSGLPNNIHISIPSQDSFDNVPDGTYTLRFTDSQECIEETSITYPTTTSTSTTTTTTTTISEIINSETLVSNSSRCWFSSPIAIYDIDSDKSWIGVVHNSGVGYTQHIIEIDHSIKTFTVTSVGSIIQQDDHNEPSILKRSSDNRLVTAFTEHNANNNIKTRISTNVADATSWNSESVYTNSTHVTYTNLFESNAGNMYIFFRETESCWSYIKSTDNGNTFSNKVQCISMNGVLQIYLKFAQSPINKDIIHILYTDGHPNREAVNVYGIYFDMSIDKFYDLSNTEITATKPFIPSNGTLILSPTSGDNSWIEDIIVTPVGDVRYLMTYYPNYIGVNYINKEVYYAELSSGILSTPIKIFDANSKNIGGISEPAYSSLSVFDKYNNDIIWAAKEVEGICEIFKVTKSGSLFTLVQKTSDNIYDQWRPLSTNNPTEEERVFWLKQISYIRWDDFNESLESFMIAYNQITTTTTTSTTTTIVLELLSNLISIWELDETSDTTVIDSHASHNGTNNGAIINQEGITDLTPCYLFDGINDYINIPSLNNLLVDNPSTLSISFWFKTTSTSPQSILGVFNTGSTTGISIVLNLTATGNAAGKFRFFIRDNNADVTEYCTTNAYPQIYNDNWHHIVMIRNGASMTFYLDGVSILLTQTGFENAAVFSTFTYDLYLGNGNNRGVKYNTFNGNLDQIAIWGRALNQSHVDILNNNGNGLSFDNWGSTTTTTTTLP